MNVVPFLDLKSTYLELKAEIDTSVGKVLASGNYILGDEVSSFESEWANFCEAKYCVGVGNGLDAIELALRAVGVESGDEVIVPSNTYVATWLAVVRCGATPVPIDPDPATLNIEREGIERAISDKTRAVIPVHLYGLPADLDPILAVSRKNGLRVVEDAAQAHGARYKGRRIGAHGDAVAWSFYPGKNLGAFGDGGAVTTNDETVADRIAVLRNYGSRRKYHNEVKGLNSRLDPMQAAILRVKLRHLDVWNGRRQRVAQRYTLAIGERAPDVAVIHTPEGFEPVWHLFVVQTEERDELASYMRSQGVSTLIHYPIPPHKQTAFLSDFGDCSFPITEKASATLLSLPIGPHLGSESLDLVIGSLLGFFES